MKKIAIIMALILGVSTGCKKYEEGPVISLRTKKARVANTWKIEKAFNDGQDVTSSYDQYELYMSKDGDAKLVAIYAYGDFTGEFETDGTWKFEDSKETLVLDYEDDDADEKYQILKLKENELWLREEGQDTELHLIPA